MGDLGLRHQELLAARLEVVTGLDTARSRLAEAQEGVRSAEGAVAVAWKSAVDAGWTATELRKLGFVAPPARRGGRPVGTGARRGSAAERDTRSAG